VELYWRRSVYFHHRLATRRLSELALDEHYGAYITIRISMLLQY